MLFLKKCLSYLIPVKIETRRGEITPVLEIALVNGKYVLNGERVNYSFGGLHEVFKRTFKKFRLEQYRFENMLILGFGAGSVAHLLRNEFNQQGAITGVENDAVMLDLALEYFNTTTLPGLTLVQEDAALFAENCTATYDLVVIDLFIEEHIPGQFQQPPFIQALRRMLRKDGVLFFNVITEEKTNRAGEPAMVLEMRKVFPALQVVPIEILGIKNTMLVVGTTSPVLHP